MAAPLALLLLLTLLPLLSFLPLPIYADPPSPSYLSFPLTNRDAQASLLRTQYANPSDLPKKAPLRDFIAVGRAMKAREEKRNKARNSKTGRPLMGSFSYLDSNVGDFYLSTLVGSPPQHLTFTLDTGSEFILTKCKPCQNCTKSEAPLFEFGKSSSFMRVPCNSSLCASSMGFQSSCVKETCIFEAQYGDGSQDAGYISVDFFHLSQDVSKSLVFGCAIVENDPVGVPASGTMGLNGGPFSFPSQFLQAGHSKKVSNKFAYCLPDRYKNVNSLGTILFGDYPLPSKLSYTPLVPPFGPLAHLYYFVKLEGISVGKKFIKLIQQQKGTEIVGTIFDSGTALTRLVEPLHSHVVQELKSQTLHLHPFSMKGFAEDVCYRVPLDVEEPPKLPLLIMHFAGGAKLELGPESVLYSDGVDKKNVVMCLAFAKAEDNVLNVIGNYQQQNYWVEHNLETLSIGLGKAKCATK